MGQDDVEWSPDGSRIAYDQMDHDFCNWPSSFAGSCSIYTVNADGTGEAKLSTGLVIDPVNPSWAPDGTTIAFSARAAEDSEQWLVYTMALDGSDPTQLAQTFPRLNRTCPRGPRRIDDRVHGRRRNDRGSVAYELWLVAPDGSERRLLSEGCCRVGGGGLPAQPPEWSPDGTQILIHEGSFITPDVIDVATATASRSTSKRGSDRLAAGPMRHTDHTVDSVPGGQDEEGEDVIGGARPARRGRMYVDGEPTERHAERFSVVERTRARRLGLSRVRCEGLLQPGEYRSTLFDPTIDFEVTTPGWTWDTSGPPDRATSVSSRTSPMTPVQLRWDLLPLRPGCRFD